MSGAVMKGTAKKPTEGSVMAHWVLKVGNLRASMAFFGEVLGLRVLRHEEFSSGCEATCNGPYGGAWSKTMVGFGREDDNFVLELTYNYGIDSYARGNDVLHIALACPAALARATALGCPVDGDCVLSPDGYRFKILPQRRCQEQWVHVALRVADLSAASQYYAEVLGMGVEGGPESSEALSVLVRFGEGEGQVGLLLVQSPPGVAVDHGLASGRVAFACPTPSVPAIYDMVTAAGGVVQTPPLTLPTPGKADVVVTILVDRDGYEICFVEDTAFFALAAPCWDVIDWEERATRGGDGARLPTAEHTHMEGVRDVNTQEEWDALMAGPGAVVAEFGADWCKNCKKVAGKVSQLALAPEHAALQVVRVDVDAMSDLAMALGVAGVPRFLVFRAGALVDDYAGASEEAVAALFDKHK